MPFTASADSVVAEAICAPAAITFCEDDDLIGATGVGSAAACEVLGQSVAGTASARRFALAQHVSQPRFVSAQYVSQPRFVSAQHVSQPDFTTAQLVELAALDDGATWTATVGTTAASELSVSARQRFTPAQLFGLAALDNGVTWMTATTARSTINVVAAGPDVTAHGVFVGTATGSTIVLDASAYGTGTVTIGDSLIGAQVRRWARAAPAPKNHRQQPIRSHGRGSQFSNASPAELTALQLLRQMVSPADFRRYLRHGFVSVHAESGLVYQVDRHQRISVWDRGERVASLCVHLRGRDLPPTDEVVAKIVIIECDEADIWKRANVSWYATRDRPALHRLGLAA